MIISTVASVVVWVVWRARKKVLLYLVLNNFWLLNRY